MDHGDQNQQPTLDLSMIKRTSELLQHAMCHSLVDDALSHISSHPHLGAQVWAKHPTT